MNICVFLIMFATFVIGICNGQACDGTDSAYQCATINGVGNCNDNSDPYAIYPSAVTTSSGRATYCTNYFGSSSKPAVIYPETGSNNRGNSVEVDAWDAMSNACGSTSAKKCWTGMKIDIYSSNSDFDVEYVNGASDDDGVGRDDYEYSTFDLNDKSIWNPSSNPWPRGTGTVALQYNSARNEYILKERADTKEFPVLCTFHGDCTTADIPPNVEAFERGFEKGFETGYKGWMKWYQTHENYDKYNNGIYYIIYLLLTGIILSVIFFTIKNCQNNKQ